MYSVFRTERFDKECAKNLSEEQRKQVEKFEHKQLVNNPYIGDPLGYKFFREKKLSGKRVYFLIYDDIKAVLMVGVSDKKAQRETIDAIKDRLADYHEVIKEAVKQHGESGHA